MIRIARKFSTSNALRAVTIENMNPFIKNVEYAVRGPIVAKALEYEKKLETGEKLPFSNVLKCNIGDCHAVGQKPITFLRQVVALSIFPQLMNDSSFPEDAISRAKRILDACEGYSLGSYSKSTGVDIIREDISKFIEIRDGLPTDLNNIFLANGASEAVKVLLQLLNTQKTGSERAGIMIPIPQYPLYSATNSEYGAHQINYFLNEDDNWGIEETELERALEENRSKCIPKAIVIINPGNPTGQVLTKNNIDMVIKFAAKHDLLILADEVYQFNVYASDRSFISFKSALHESEYRDQVQVASFMSASKGYMGECGFRGGFCELINIPTDVRDQLYKLLSARLCTSVPGQALLDAIVNPPLLGEPSFESFEAEKQEVLDQLALKGSIVHSTLNKMEGYNCNPIQGAMYAFPRIDLPNKFIADAKNLNVQPDFLYCSNLLDKTGICIVPGSGFGQREGTYHFRITILPTVDQIRQVMERIQDFHSSFMKS